MHSGRKLPLLRLLLLLAPVALLIAMQYIPHRWTKPEATTTSTEAFFTTRPDDGDEMHRLYREVYRPKPSAIDPR